MTVAVLVLATVFQLSISGCTLRCIDALYLSGPEGVFADEEAACLDKQGASQGFLITPAFAPDKDVPADCLSCGGGSIHPPRRYREPPEKPPESSREVY